MDVNWEAAYCTALNAYFSTAYARGGRRRERQRKENEAQCRLLRDIFGNPFRPVSLKPSLLTPGVGSLAQSIYCEYAFDRLPELADALEGTGASIRMLSGTAANRGSTYEVAGC